MRLVKPSQVVSTHITLEHTKHILGIHETDALSTRDALSGAREREPRHRKKKAKKPLWRRMLKWLFVLSFLGALCGVGGVAGIFYHYGRDLPDIRSAQDYAPKQVSRVYAADGSVIDSFDIVK